MISLFQFAPNDQALSYLNSIFGSMNGVINPSGGGGISISLLGTMFKTFNSIILAVGALVVVYVTIVGVIMTAHEGEFMGKKWNNIWIPIRTVLGIAALVPTASGYSAIQIVMMWVIVQGIGAADMLWTTALNYVSQAGSPYASATLPTTNVQQAMTGWYSTLVCDASAQMATNVAGTSSPGTYYCANSSDSWCTNRSASSPGADGIYQFPLSTTTMGSSTANSLTLQFGPTGGSCGTISYCNLAAACAGPQANTPPQDPANPSTLSCAACVGQINALNQIEPALWQVAQQFVTIDSGYQNFIYNSNSPPPPPPSVSNTWSFMSGYCTSQGYGQSQCCTGGTGNGSGCQQTNVFPPSNQPVPGQGFFTPQYPSQQAINNIYLPYGYQNLQGNNFINAAVSQYMTTLTNQVTDFLTAQQPSLSGTLQQAQSTGWILAGGYYYYISRQTANNLQSALPVLSAASNFSNGTQNVMNNYRNNYTAAGELVSAMNSGTTGSGGLASIGPLGPAVAPLTSVLSDVSAAFTASTTSSGDPISALISAGNTLVVAAEGAFVAILVATLAVGLGGNLMPIFLGIGLTNNPVGPTQSLLYMAYIPMVLGLMGILITMGGLFSVYVPLIPYVVFTIGAIGWLISTVEAMVAGPLVAVGILSPSGNHELLGKAEPALMLLFNVFLRPSLMIFGMMASMLLASVVVTMINALFWSIVVQGISSGPAGASTVAILSSPVEMIIFLAAYVMLLVAALNKCFAAIYIIPQQVMRWISGQGDQYGEAEVLGEVKRSTDSAAAGVGGFMRKGAGTAKEARVASVKSQQKAAEEDKSKGEGKGVDTTK